MEPDIRIARGLPNDTVLVMINSSKRSHGNPNFFNVALQGQIKRIKRLEFIEAEVPYVWYDIGTGNCNICNIGGVDVSIPAGIYTNLTDIKNAIVTASPGATVNIIPVSTTSAYISIGDCKIDGSVNLGAATLGFEHNLSTGTQTSTIPLPIKNANFVFKGPNNTLTITFDGVDRTITVVPGNYTHYDLCQSLQTSLRALPNINASSTVTYDICTNRYTFSITTIAPITTTVIQNTLLANYLGFTSALTSTSNPKIFDSSPSYRLKKVLQIQSYTIGTLIRTLTGDKTIVHRIPVKVNPSDYIADSSEYRQPLYLAKPQAIQTLDLALLDEDGCLVYLNGFDWSLSILIETE